MGARRRPRASVGFVSRLPRPLRLGPAHPVGGLHTVHSHTGPLAAPEGPGPPSPTAQLGAVATAAEDSPSLIDYGAPGFRGTRASHRFNFRASHADHGRLHGHPQEVCLRGQHPGGPWGPYPVVEVWTDNPNSVRLDFGDPAKNRHNVINVSQLKPFIGAPNAGIMDEFVRLLSRQTDRPVGNVANSHFLKRDGYPSRSTPIRRIVRKAVNPSTLRRSPAANFLSWLFWSTCDHVRAQSRDESAVDSSFPRCRRRLGDLRPRCVPRSLSPRSCAPR